jgi:cyclophilin family peptidyl-prolyl cis-trans isomerase
MGKLLLWVMIAIAGILGIAAIISAQNKPVQNPYSDLANQPTAAPTAVPTPQGPLVPQNEWVTNASSAAIVTPRGEIDIQLYPADAPKTVTNFATLAKLGFYNGLTFHRVVEGFVIQGGDPNGNGTGGTSIYGPTFEDELDKTTASYKAGYLEGVIAMANRGPNTNSSQFFIMLADNPSLPKNYTIFGKVTSGMDVVKSIKQGDKMLRVTVQ